MLLGGDGFFRFPGPFLGTVYIEFGASFLSLGTTDIGGGTMFCCGGLSCMLMASTIPGLYTRDPLNQEKSVSRLGQRSPGGKTIPRSEPLL